MLERLTINISEPKRCAIEILANEELRDMQLQIQPLLHKELERRGLLAITAIAAPVFKGVPSISMKEQR
jgi:hypothetical protein